MPESPLSVDKDRILRFVEQAFRNIELPPLSPDDLSDIGAVLQEFITPAEQDMVLPCDVKLPPATTISAGCKLSTLILALTLDGRPKSFAARTTASVDKELPIVERLLDLSIDLIRSDWGSANRVLNAAAIIKQLVGAAEALGAMPEGYCFCSRDRIGDDSKTHEPECSDLRAALARAGQ